MASLPFGVVIIDESHNLRCSSSSKKADTKQTEACAVVALKARRCILLTGTPSISKPHDLFRQVKFLEPTVEDIKCIFCCIYR